MNVRNGRPYRTNLYSPLTRPVVATFLALSFCLCLSCAGAEGADLPRLVRTVPLGLVNPEDDHGPCMIASGTDGQLHIERASQVLGGMALRPESHSLYVTWSTKQDDKTVYRLRALDYVSGNVIWDVEMPAMVRLAYEPVSDGLYAVWSGQLACVDVASGALTKLLDLPDIVAPLFLHPVKGYRVLVCGARQEQGSGKTDKEIILKLYVGSTPAMAVFDVPGIPLLWSTTVAVLESDEFPHEDVQGPDYLAETAPTVFNACDHWKSGSVWLLGHEYATSQSGGYKFYAAENALYEFDTVKGAFGRSIRSPEAWAAVADAGARCVYLLCSRSKSLYRYQPDASTRHAWEVALGGTTGTFPWELVLRVVGPNPWHDAWCYLSARRAILHPSYDEVRGLGVFDTKQARTMGTVSLPERVVGVSYDPERELICALGAAGSVSVLEW